MRLIHVARLLDSDSNYDRWLTEYERSIDLNPGEATPLRNLANLLLDSGDLEGALTYFQKALKLRPNTHRSP